MRHDRGAGRRRGATLLELLVGACLAVLVLGACLGAVAAASRVVAAVGARADAEDTAHLAIEAFRFDVRRAGYDPAALGIEALPAASPTALDLHADLDADGALDTASEEVTRWACLTGVTPRLSRVVGAQSMPVAAPVTRCALRYLDGAGVEVAPAAGGLDAGERSRVRRVVLELAVEPAGGGAPSVRLADIALWRPR